MAENKYEIGEVMHTICIPLPLAGRHEYWDELYTGVAYMKIYIPCDINGHTDSFIIEDAEECEGKKELSPLSMLKVVKHAICKYMEYKLFEGWQCRDMFDDIEGKASISISTRIVFACSNTRPDLSSKGAAITGLYHFYQNSEGVFKDNFAEDKWTIERSEAIQDIYDKLAEAKKVQNHV